MDRSLTHLRNYYVSVWKAALRGIFGWTPQRIERWIEQYRDGLRPDDEPSMLYHEEPMWYVTGLLMPAKLLWRLDPAEERLLIERLFDAIRPKGKFDEASIESYDWSAAKDRAVEILAEYGTKLPDWEANRKGMCEHCRCPISVERLQLVPSATTCWACQTQIERGLR